MNIFRHNEKLDNLLENIVKSKIETRKKDFNLTEDEREEITAKLIDQDREHDFLYDNDDTFLSFMSEFLKTGKKERLIAYLKSAPVEYYKETIDDLYWQTVTNLTESEALYPKRDFPSIQANIWREFG